MAFEVNERSPPGCAPFPVDSLDQAVDLLVDQPILRDMPAGRNADLNVSQSLAIIRVKLEEPIERLQPFRNSLRVIDALDADSDQVSPLAELALELFDFVLDLGADAQRRLSVEIDADREWPHQG